MRSDGDLLHGFEHRRIPNSLSSTLAGTNLVQ